MPSADSGGGPPTSRGARRSSNQGRQRVHTPAVAPRQPKFEGRCNELNGHIYDCSDFSQQSDQFVKTTREIADYVGRTFQYDWDMRFTVETLKKVEFVQPTNPPPEATKRQMLIWETQFEEYFQRKSHYERNLQTLYFVVWGQCSDAMRGKLRARADFETMSKEADGLALLWAIKDVVYLFENHQYLPHALYKTMRRFYMCSQNQNMTVREYLDQFQNLVDVIEHHGGSVVEHPAPEEELAAKRGQSLAMMSAEDRANLKRENNTWP